MIPNKDEMAKRSFAGVEDTLKKCSEIFSNTQGSEFDHRVRFLTIRAFANQMLKETENNVPSLMLMVEPALESLIADMVKNSIVSIRIQIKKEDQNGMPGL